MSETRPGYLLSHRETVLAVAGLCAGIFLATLSQTSVVTALPVIADDLGGFNRYSWVVTLYFLCSIVSVPAWSALSDSYGRRPFVIAAISIFVVGAIVAASAQSMTQLIIARGLQGIGGGGIIPIGIAAVGDLVPASDRGRWQAMLGVTMGFSTVSGPIVGGWITEAAGWRWIFVSLIPIGIAALAIIAATLRTPPHPERARGFDARGLVLFGLGVTTLVITFSGIGQDESRGLLATTVGATLALVLLAAFWIHEKSASVAIMPPATMAIRTFRLLAGASFAVGSAMLTALLYMPLFLQGVRGESVASAGVQMASLMIANVAGSLFTGFAIARTGRYRWVLISGSSLMAAAMLVMAMMGEGSPTVVVVAALGVFGLGLGFLIQNVMLVAQNAVPSRNLGSATGTIHMLRNLGGVIGVSLMTAILAARLPGHASAAEVSPGELASGLRFLFLINVPILLGAVWLFSRVQWARLDEAVRSDVRVGATAE